MTGAQIGSTGVGRRSLGLAPSELPPVDSNHHSRIQRPMSCHWTRGQRAQKLLAARTPQQMSAVDLSAELHSTPPPGP